MFNRTACGGLIALTPSLTACTVVTPDAGQQAVLIDQP